MATIAKPKFVDVNNPALAIDCPRCGLVTARFLEYCSNCGRSIWPSGPYAASAFALWREADRARSAARRYDLELAASAESTDYDYDARAHELGIHIFPRSISPFPICFGLLFMALAAVPLPTPARLVLGAFGICVFLFGVISWVLVEDQKMYPHDAPASSSSREGDSQ